MSRTTFVIPVYPGTTHLDFTAPHQFFARVPDADVVVASRTGDRLVCDGLTFADLSRLADVAGCDVLCVPGGFGTFEAIHDREFLDEIRRLAAEARFVTSVCTGSIILAAAGLLDGRRAACHWYWRDALARFPGVTVDDARLVRDGRVITGGGVTAGLDLAIAVVAALAGEEQARAIQLGLEYAPEPPFDSGRPELAAADILEAVRAVFGARDGAIRERLDAFLTTR